jgi:hypothetical protein
MADDVAALCELLGIEGTAERVGCASLVVIAVVVGPSG